MTTPLTRSEFNRELNPYLLPPLVDIVWGYADGKTIQSRVVGLVQIIYDKSGVPNGSFVFDTAEKAQAAAQDISRNVGFMGILHKMRGSLSKEADREISYIVNSMQVPQSQLLSEGERKQLQTQQGFLEWIQSNMPQEREEHSVEITVQ